MFFLGVYQTQDGRWTRGDITKVRNIAETWAMRNGYERNARDAMVLYGETEEKIEVLWTNLTTGNLDKKREQMEQGNGGDHDQPYVMGIPNSAVAWRDWAQMIASVKAGELGGPDDGADLATA